jgi:hypothetical protein
VKAIIVPLPARKVSQTSVWLIDQTGRSRVKHDPLHARLVSVEDGRMFVLTAGLTNAGAGRQAGLLATYHEVDPETGKTRFEMKSWDTTRSLRRGRLRLHARCAEDLRTDWFPQGPSPEPVLRILTRGDPRGVKLYDEMPDPRLALAAVDAKVGKRPLPPALTDPWSRLAAFHLAIDGFLKERQPEAALRLIEARGNDADIGHRRTSLLMATARVLAVLGRFEAAQEQFELAMQEEPGSRHATERFTWWLSTTPDARFRDPERALELVRQSRQARWGPMKPEVEAAALAANGQYTLAAKLQRQALASAKDARAYRRVQMQRCLEAYETNRPWIERIR